MQQVAYVLSDGGDMRSELVGWTFEDPSLLVKKGLQGALGDRIFIGHTPAPKDIPYYGTILEMLADGWKLLSVPVKSGSIDDGKHVYYSWWLTREKGDSR